MKEEEKSRGFGVAEEVDINGLEMTEPAPLYGPSVLVFRTPNACLFAHRPLIICFYITLIAYR